LKPVHIVLQNGLKATIRRMRIDEKPSKPNSSPLKDDRNFLYLVEIHIGEKTVGFVFLSQDMDGLVLSLQKSLEQKLVNSTLIIYEKTIYRTFALESRASGLLLYKTPTQQAKLFIGAVLTKTPPEITALMVPTQKKTAESQLKPVSLTTFQKG